MLVLLSGGAGFGSAGLGEDETRGTGGGLVASSGAHRPRRCVCSGGSSAAASSSGAGKVVITPKIRQHLHLRTAATYVSVFIGNMLLICFKDPTDTFVAPTNRRLLLFRLASATPVQSTVHPSVLCGSTTKQQRYYVTIVCQLSVPNTKDTHQQYTGIGRLNAYSMHPDEIAKEIAVPFNLYVAIFKAPVWLQPSSVPLQ
ncbi:unnamed protein product [Miscanthus lutarioriparius]|uniref:Uncharacterized protein n=1 Tax=Miscanthus lutarioriparius TaxID=422564 RepID=A0A811MC06_9POAL|nr:unnamed protein product [Miscanthus lutarioriparius]